MPLATPVLITELQDFFSGDPIPAAKISKKLYISIDDNGKKVFDSAGYNTAKSRAQANIDIQNAKLKKDALAKAQKLAGIINRYIMTGTVTTAVTTAGTAVAQTGVGTGAIT